MTRRRMLRLARLGVVLRFRPPALGSALYHYVLSAFGARVVAAQRGVEFKELRFREEDAEELPHRPELRVLAFVDTLADGEHLVFTHGGVIRVLLRERGRDEEIPPARLQQVVL